MKFSAIFECLFDIAYLITILTLGLIMLFTQGNNEAYTYFAWMCVLLGGGDCFHLIPRMYSKFVEPKPSVTAAIGYGNLITGISMTYFYILFLEVISYRYNRPLKVIRIVMYVLLAIRVILLLLPQNNWAKNEKNQLFNILRNIPFILIGLIIMYLLFDCTHGHPDDGFKWMWLYILISFGCYTPVALGELKVVFNVVLMILKTVAYMAAAFTGFYVLQPNK